MPMCVKWRAWLLALGVILLARESGSAAPPAGPERIAIFPAEPKHNHASCVVETADGSLLAAWYSGSGERKADDVVIQGAWLRKGSKQWEPRFLMADTPGYPDCNPALFAAPDRSLWLFWPTILDHRWEGALLKFARCDHPSPQAGPPKWTSTGVLHVTPTNFADAMQRAIAALSVEDRAKSRSILDESQDRSRDELYQRLGWMPRVRAISLPSGRWILPLYSDTFSASIMAISDDRGATWKASQPLIGFGNIQPCLVRKNDGTLFAYMRDNGPHHRIRLSKSSDDGISWSPVTDTAFPNPGAGVDAIRLASGRWALVYNDLPRGRNSLAISVSDDEGTSWKWMRHLERWPDGQYHYPSMLQASDGSIHVTYTLSRPGQGSTIMHAKLGEEWLLSKDAD
jgi:predicted neuraminidase